MREVIKIRDKIDTSDLDIENKYKIINKGDVINYPKKDVVLLGYRARNKSNKHSTGLTGLIDLFKSPRMLK